MSTAQAPFLLFGLNVGVIATEATWQVVGPSIGARALAWRARTDFTERYISKYPQR
jgi:hypothetical protein